ncbi:hypothetical protein [Streptomyces sp. CT34]|uniref:hypothetical protein n=1 Tax=Streptomyces sp. CT34 TaxID=1553907 RepID=UPI0005BD3B7D|nr:hypothetical protein [Streptomyces sp. CT34]
MASIEQGQRQQGPATARRTEGDLKRRQALADAAAGIPASSAEVPGEDGKIERFRCVIYLSSAPDTDSGEMREECTEYAEAFGWEIAAVIEERTGLLPPEGREGLRQAVDRIKDGKAGAVLTASRSMISPVAEEYDRVVGEIEKAGGFLHVTETAGNDHGIER